MGDVTDQYKSQNYMKPIKSIILAIVTALFAVSIPVAQSNAQSLAAAPAVSASEAVFYTQGVIEGKIESSQILATPPSLGGPYSFRVLSYMNYVMSSMFFDLPIAAAYFIGKADTFRDLADFYGEP